MDVVFATGTFYVEGVGRIDGGTVWPAGDPVVKAHPHGFTDDPEQSPAFCRTAGAAAVEQATAAPGERRATRRAR